MFEFAGRIQPAFHYQLCLEMPLGRILALDVGEKRVGVAISDPLGYSAQPLTVLPRRPHGAFLSALGDLARDYEVTLVLLGLPRRTTGEKRPEAQRVLALAREIHLKLGLACETWDEWLTTVAAEKVLLEGGLKRAERKLVIDKTAAALILDGYLNFLANGKRNDDIGQ
ncbi:Holliday junction resolvase RuvX [Deltaproteobacteria bacterium OttesenSCG-928-M10]|nr:Holliday junction resolvase RuvX [Deltaproteobacteria bacterium OttesenSCG-928-M10]